MDTDVMKFASLILVATNGIIEAAVAPLREKFPKLDLWWMMYVSWAVAAALSFLAGLNLFGALFPNVFVGQLLTALVVGRGSNVLADLLKATKHKE